jgi:glycosyltransferase involved in cell wall biosynthesis
MRTIAINTRFLLSGRLEGLGWYTHEVTRRLVALYPDDRFVLLFDRPCDPAFVYGPNVTPVVLYLPARHPLLWYAWFEWAVPAVLRRVGADVFFSPDSYLSLRSHVPTVMTVHDLVPLQMPDQIPWAPRTYYQYFLPRYLRRADALVTVSEHTRSDIEAYLGPKSTPPVTVAYNGGRSSYHPISTLQKTALRAQYAAEKPFFLYTGAIHPRKNIPRLIRAFDQFKAKSGSDVQLLLAGRWAWQTGEVRAAYEATRHRDSIRFLGYVPDDTLAALTATALAAVNVSLGEGFGLPVLEAMMCDTPVVCSNTTALREVGGAAALQVDPADEQAIAQALYAVATSPELREQMIERGRAQRTQFSWDRAAEQIGQVIMGLG